jgi:hypothetical protein
MIARKVKKVVGKKGERGKIFFGFFFFGKFSFLGKEKGGKKNKKVFGRSEFFFWQIFFWRGRSELGEFFGAGSFLEKRFNDLTSGQVSGAVR